jgi:hypothetical protein
MQEWLDLMLRLTSVPVATLAMYEGAKQLASIGFGWRQVTLLLLGAAFLGGDAALLARTSASITRSLEALNAGPIRQVTKEQIAHLPPAEREIKSRMIAGINYGSKGVLTVYYTASGSEVLYAPSQAEITIREKQGEEIGLIRGRLASIFTQIYVVGFAGLAAAIAGLIVGSCLRRQQLTNG